MTLALCAAVPVSAQTPASSAPIRVFIDCQWQCDHDFLRTEIPWIDHVRDRADADVHVLVTTASTGASGMEFSLAFLGLREFAGLVDTLKVVSPEADSEDKRRRAVAETIKQGLVRYAVRRPGGDRIRVTFAAPATGATPAGPPKKDPWNLWVFRTRAQSYMNGEKSSRSTSLYGSVSANRISPAWKANISMSGDYNENSFTFQDGSKFNSYSHGYGLRELLVKSRGPHWSIGQRASVTSSTYQNQKLATRFAPAIEYNIYPYAESTRRQLRLQYAIGGVHYRYQDTTIFEKLSETRPENSLLASLDMRQPWGNVSISLEGAAYLDNFKQNRIEFEPEFDVRLFKGLSLNMFGYIYMLRDQIYLAKGGATDEEVLLRRRQLASTYQYFVGTGLTYTFGSIYNNVVNPRFGN